MFDKSLLPPPRTFYERELGKLSHPSRGWAKANCPFHQSKSRTSFSINLDSGSFYCFGCGVKGGDIVAFIRTRDNCDFKTATRLLGCWQEDGKSTKMRPGPALRHLAMDFVIDCIEYHTQVEDEPWNELQLLRRFYADAKDRLSEIRQADAEKFEGEEEMQWSILADSWELMQMEAADGQ